MRRQACEFVTELWGDLITRSREDLRRHLGGKVRDEFGPEDARHEFDLDDVEAILQLTAAPISRRK